MVIDLSQVMTTEDARMQQEAVLQMPTFRNHSGEYELVDKQPILFTFENVQGKELRITADVALAAIVPCDRCLDPVRIPLHFQIDKNLSLEDGVATDEETEGTDYLIGFDLDADRLVCAEILVNWPMKVLCRSDCKGICKVCGMNLNHGTCNCRQAEPDPRMAAIQDIFNKFKEV